MGYLHHARSRIDRRSVRISLTPQGKDVRDLIAALYEKHVFTVEQIGGVSIDEFKTVNNALTRLERFWTDQIKYRL
jgi:DNA-binding MarR family transcriptional regulator